MVSRLGVEKKALFIVNSIRSSRKIGNYNPIFVQKLSEKRKERFYEGVAFGG